jgi:hypothetical protein
LGCLSTNRLPAECFTTKHELDEMDDELSEAGHPMILASGVTRDSFGEEEAQDS